MAIFLSIYSQDMYFKYIWNNFLHIQVEICTAMILAMPPAQSENPEINRDQDQEPVRESHLIKHVRLYHPLHRWHSCQTSQLTAFCSVF